jgi:hypothetical protein
VKEGEQVGLGEQLGEGPQHLLAAAVGDQPVVNEGDFHFAKDFRF